jgi:hypothetical protein
VSTFWKAASAAKLLFQFSGKFFDKLHVGSACYHFRRRRRPKSFFQFLKLLAKKCEKIEKGILRGVIRVTRLGEFSPFGIWFSLGRFFCMPEVAQILRQLYHGTSFLLFFKHLFFSSTNNDNAY